MTFQIILPSIYQPYTDACIKTMHPRLHENTLIWDNTIKNIGVSAAWNEGIKTMKQRGCDWLIILSATMRFGHRGGLDLLEQLETTNLVVAEPEMGHMWHLMSIHRSVIEAVGTFDENFFAYYEDTDYAQRIRYAMARGMLPDRWAKIFIDVASMGNAHGSALAGFRIDTSKQQEYYIRKWGGLPGQQKYLHPFNDPSKPLDWWVKE